jgi:serine/threonine protein kinase
MYNPDYVAKEFPEEQGTRNFQIVTYIDEKLFVRVPLGNSVQTIGDLKRFVATQLNRDVESLKLVVQAKEREEHELILSYPGTGWMTKVLPNYVPKTQPSTPHYSPPTPNSPTETFPTEKYEIINGQNMQYNVLGMLHTSEKKHVTLLKCESRTNGRLYVLKLYNIIENQLESMNVLQHWEKMRKITSERLVVLVETFRFVNQKYGDCLVTVTPLYDNGDLQKFIDTAKVEEMPFPEMDVLRMLHQISTGLDAMHAQQFVHLDLSPDDILVSKTFDLVIGDFGLCEQVNNIEKIDLVQNMYQSPEMIQHQTYDWHTDIFSLGCIFFELMTFKKKFIASEMRRIVKEHKDLATYMREIHMTINGCGYSEELATLVCRMLSYDPQLRPSCRDILNFNFFIPKPSFGYEKLTSPTSQKETDNVEKMLHKLERVEKSLDILMQEKRERDIKALEQQHIYENTKLFSFYSQLQGKINKLYAVCCNISTGMVVKQEHKNTSRLKTAGDGLELAITLAGTAIDFVVPGVGTAMKYVGKGANIAMKATAMVNEEREITKIKRFADMFMGITEFEQVSKTVATILTRYYETQIQQLTTKMKIQQKKGVVSKVKGWLNKIDLSDDYANGGAEDLAEFAVAKIVDALREGHICPENTSHQQRIESMAMQMVEAVCRPKPKLLKPLLEDKQKLEREVADKNWTFELFAQCGVELEDGRRFKGREKGTCCQMTSRYGFRQGTMDDVIQLELLEIK